MSLPTTSRYVVVGAGIHGLSTAYHLALALEESGRGSGKDVIVLEKNRLGAMNSRNRADNVRVTCTKA